MLVRNDVKPHGQRIKVIPGLRWQTERSLGGGLETAASGSDLQYKPLPRIAQRAALWVICKGEGEKSP